MSAPQILIENQNALGHNVEQISLDTNRVNIHSETTSRLANAISISSRGLWVDVSSWLVYCAAAFSVASLALDMGAAPWAVALLFGVPLISLTILIGAVIDRRPALAPHGMIRFLLLFIGAVIAVS
ncbi:MAG: hypothetical protein DCF15_17225 [Phormidesmis priestleyi]|uniref:Uncharacterized protein n=1 Tax=Phormidesmis priestleyi TaxID=268141 RepID=A0A2W4WXM3_9CYAN|nr:MAG: hypothetical protein DCF15_17225 [Phormidesmis priestleyi]